MLPHIAGSCKKTGFGKGGTESEAVNVCRSGMS